MDKQVTHVVFLVDGSGSMQGLRFKAVEVVNKNLDAVRAAAEKTGQETTVSLAVFNTSMKEVFWVRPSVLPTAFDQGNFWPTGGTALLDAVGNTIEKLYDRPDVNNPNVSFLINVITDGEELSSTRFDAKSLKAAMDYVVATDRWIFTFLVPPGKKEALVKNFQIPDGNVAEWELSAAGLETAAKQVTTGIDSYYATRSAGGTKTSAFFTDMSNVSSRTVARQLSDIRHLVDVVDVNRTAQISEFVTQDMHRAYIAGRAFYQLNKPEWVQTNKKVILRNRKDGKVYGGDDARHMLGLPDNTDIQVKPGNHGDWDIFIQSMSTNRKLLPGTKLAYLRDP